MTPRTLRLGAGWANILAVYPAHPSTHPIGDHVGLLIGSGEARLDRMFQPVAVELYGRDDALISFYAL